MDSLDTLIKKQDLWDISNRKQFILDLQGELLYFLIVKNKVRVRILMERYSIEECFWHWVMMFAKQGFIEESMIFIEMFRPKEFVMYGTQMQGNLEFIRDRHTERSVKINID
jgi:hypothetical protein